MERLGPPTRRTTMGRVLAVLALLLIAACGEDTAASTPSAGPLPTVTSTHRPEALEGKGPPPFRLRYDGQELALPAYAFCYDGLCADGDDLHPPNVGSPAEVMVLVPVERFDLSVSFNEGRPGCGRSTPAEVTETGDGWYAVRPHGKAGTYTVELFAQGQGDMVGKFLWTTAVDGPLARPASTLALIADHDGEPDSYGLELSITNLAVTPEAADARITVTAANGKSMVIDADRERSDCIPDGTVRFNGPESQAKAAAKLGGFPFTMEVELTLDGLRHLATATYPDDEIEDYGPYVRLDFDPPLSGQQ